MHIRLPRLMRLCGLLALALAVSRIAFAQGPTARLSGVVTDQAGAVIVGATINVHNTEIGLERSTTTSNEGQYLLTELRPGFYEITVEASGFASSPPIKVELTVGENATRNFSLRVAGTTQEIDVPGGVSLIESTRTEQSQVIDERRIVNLPINGRNFLDFVLLTPNVDVGRSNIGQIRPGEPNQIDLSFMGLEEIASQVTVDGADNTNRTFGRSRSTPSEEAVREFRVVTNSYAADLGPAAGAVISIITRSGTNALHGSAYYYLRNDALDARNLLAAPGFDELRQNQFGGTLGGPLIRNRLFLFGNYEGQRRSESPFYSSVLLNNLTAINAVKQSLGLSPEVLAGKTRQTNYDSLTIRNDYQATAGHLLSLIYRFRDDRDRNLGTATGQFSAPSNFRHADISDHALVMNATSILSSRLVNQGLFQFARRKFDFPSVDFEPYLQIPYTLDMGRHLNAPDATGETRFEFGDTLSYTRGAHNVKFGGQLYHLRLNITLDVADPAFAVFPNLDAFFGRPPFPPFPFAAGFSFAQAPDGTRPPAPREFTSSANLPIFDALTHDHSSLTHYALFAQDQWRVTPKLTLNYGLRWDVDDRPKELFDGYYKVFQPRAGIAYSLLADRLVLRAGGGIYQGVIDAATFGGARILGQDPTLAVNPDFSVVRSSLRVLGIANPTDAAPAFLQFVRTGIYTSPASGQPPFPALVLATHRTHPRSLYSYQWNVLVDYRIANDLALSVGYVGVRGLNLSGGSALNIAPALRKLPTGENDYSIAPGVLVPRVFNPLVAANSDFFDGLGQSNYHAGTITLTERFSRHYSFTTNYTWSKAIDNSGSQNLADLPEDNYRRDLERARSKQHVPHRFVGSFIAEGPEKSWLRDFRFSFISTLAGAHYYTIFAGSDVNHDGNPRTDRVGTVGRNTFKGDGYANLDLRLSRVIRFSDRTRAEIIAEAFNLLNTLNVTEVNSVYGAPQFVGPEPKKFGGRVAAPLSSFGTIRAIAPPRQIQFAFRLTF